MKPLLYVDGYNVIGAWREAEARDWPLDECRDRLVHLLADYAGYTGQEVWLVFDGHLSDRLTRSMDKRAGLMLVYTKHGETADQFIERSCGALPPYREARVATSDGLEQTMILGRGATRLSARELWRELHQTRVGGRQRHLSADAERRTPLFAGLTDEQREALERLRRER